MFLDTDHSGLNKFGRQDENFELILKEIIRMAQDGPTIVANKYLANGIEHTKIHEEIPVNSLL